MKPDDTNKAPNVLQKSEQDTDELIVTILPIVSGDN